MIASDGKVNKVDFIELRGQLLPLLQLDPRVIKTRKCSNHLFHTYNSMQHDTWSRDLVNR